MYHSITIGNKNTWDDWRLIPSSRPLVAPPSVKENSLDIPGTNGMLDSTGMHGRVFYGNRTGSWQFIVMNDFRSWEEAYSDIMAHLHGQAMIAVLEDDPEYYYTGRFKVNQWASNKDYSGITIDYNVDPYKYKLAYKNEEWEWSPLNPTGSAKNYRMISVSGTQDVTINGRKEHIIPDIIVSSDMMMTYNEATYNLKKGHNRPSGLILASGSNTLAFSGNGIISIDYRGGVL
jgi:phage-related protein